VSDINCIELKWLSQWFVAYSSVLSCIISWNEKCCDVLCHTYVHLASIYQILPQIQLDPDPNRIQIPDTLDLTGSRSGAPLLSMISFSLIQSDYSWCLLDHCDNQLITLSSKIFRLLQFSSLLMVPKQWKTMVQYVWSVRLVVVAELHIMYAWSVNWQMVFLVDN